VNDKQIKLLRLLREMFQLDQIDLDFGIYRVMNQKSDEINDFLNNKLIQSIRNAFADLNSDGLKKELDEAIKQAQALGADPESLPKVKELRNKVNSYSNGEESENEVYSYLINFFNRYYKDGDFISQRRYKKDTYSIPYEGEELKLHWANSDQYYIKTSEFFRDYTFTINNKKFHFKIVDADTEKNNNKSDINSERRFVISDNTPILEKDGELFIRFEFKPIGRVAQNKLNEKNIEVIFAQDNQLISELKELSPTEKNKNRTILERHLTDYTSRNSFDFFIHKDLNGFLNRELDFFIKNEILYIDDILENSFSNIEESLNKIKVFKNISKKIISFLSQLEDFQKKLWLKKKFIVDTNYCITLDKIDESYYEEILTNEKQIEEWKRLFSIEIKSIDDLKREKYLVLDTKFFNSIFKDKLVSEFENIDEECDGVLINSDNFGALNFLQKRYKNQIKSIYIDPPYNTKASEIIYKNNYKHSSWMGLIENRVSLSQKLLTKDGILCATIDDYEFIPLWNILENTFSKDNHLGNVSIRINPKGRITARKVSPTNEFAIFFGNSEESKISKLPTSPEEKSHNYVQDENGKWYVKVNLRKQGVDSEGEKDGIIAPRHYPIYFDPKTKKVSVTEELEIKILPIDSDGNKRIWRRGKEVINKMFEDGDIWCDKTKNGYQVYFKFTGGLDGEIPKTMWVDSKYSASEYGTRILDNILGQRELFSYPKSPFATEDCINISLTNNKQTILDFFAGSGTTGHAVINLNRKDNGKRKYILVEMGEYFDTVTKPRIQKVIYSDKWKNGNPENKDGVSQMFKYFKLESYEDTLNNIAFKKADHHLFTEDVKEDYLLNYMLDYETNESLLNIDNFKNPFEYKLNIATSSVGETVETNVDLIETFNYLIGLKVKTKTKMNNFFIIEGENLKKENILIIWREGNDNEKLNNFFSKIDFSVYDREFDTIYVNGDNNIANLKKEEDHFKVKLIEEEFKNRMFGE